jgi:hypothetical protein
MMKSQSGFWFALQPLYVIVASVLGFGFVVFWLKGPFLISNYPDPYAFTNVAIYPVWVFEHGITFAFVTVLFLPLWKQFFDLTREIVAGRSSAFKLGIGVMLAMGVAVLLVFFSLIIELSKTVSFSRLGLWPDELTIRLNILFFYPIAGVVPIPLSALLLFIQTNLLSQRIERAQEDQGALFPITYKLLRIRSFLQNGLLIMGLVVSMVPIDTATIRSVFIILDPAYETEIPAIAVIAYGLCFTALLIVFYAPTHIALTQVSQKLRDALYPITSPDDLEKYANVRKQIEDWLQINLSIMDNLKAGIVALAPLLTSFVTSLFGGKL